MGGIGLFLLGMTLMTDSLKALAGDSLRQWLGRFTGSPLKAMFSGIGFTLVVQSSAATTLATIGFVSAGVITFAQAIGVIIGANIGTTSTGWIVAFLGLKFSIASFALPMIGIGAMLKLFGKDRVALSGLTLASFGLIFFGIDLLQTAMMGFAERVDLSVWSNDSLTTRFILVIIGLVMTVLLQSSSAALTATLAALASQAIDVQQAMALVIGQNIGTVAPAVLAAMSATTSAKRTVAVHVIFNVVTAVFAFFLLMPAMLWLFNHYKMIDLDDTVIIAAFHTAFSLLGALIFMPFTQQLQVVISRLLPEKDLLAIRYLDESLFSVPAVAIATAQDSICHSLADFYRLLIKAGRGEIIGAMINSKELDSVLTKVDVYLHKMPVPQSQADQKRLTKLLRLVIYTRVIREDFQHTAYLDILRSSLVAQDLQTFIDLSEQMMVFLLQTPAQDIPQQYVHDLMIYSQQIKTEQPQLRQHIVAQSARSDINAAQTLDLIVAQRWLERLVEHTTKIAILLQEQNGH